MRDFSSRPHRRRPRGREWAFLAVGALGLLLSAAAALDAWRDLRAARARVVEVRADRDAAAARVRALEAMTRRDTVASQAWLTVEAPPPRVVADLAELLPPEVRLEDLHLKYGARLEVAITVVARRPADYDLFLERLSASPRFGDLAPEGESRGAEVRGSVRAAYLEEAR